MICIWTQVNRKEKKMLTFLLGVSLFMSFIDALETPVNVTINGVSKTSVQVAWSSTLKNRTGDLYYILRYKAEESVFTSLNVWETEKTVRNLEPDTTYSFSVSSNRGRRQSDWSPDVSWTTVSPVDRRSSDAPRNLKIRFQPSGFYKVKWKPPIKPKQAIEGYLLTWKMKGQTEVHRETTKRLSHVVTLKSNSHYVFKVQYLHNGGKGPSSAAVDIFTSKPKSRQNMKSFILNRLDTNTIAASWESQLKKNDGYKLQYKRVGRGDICTVVIPPGENSYNITNVLQDETYRVRIATQTENGTEPFSKWKTVKPVPVLPQVSTVPTVTARMESANALNFTDTDISAQSIKLTWSEPNNIDVLAYSIQLYKGEELLEGKVRTETTATFNSLQPGTTYTFILVVFTPKGPQPEVTNISLTTRESVVPQITVMQNVSVPLGDFVRLRCQVTGDPLPTVVWKKDGAILEEIFQSSRDLKDILFGQPAHFRQKIKSTLGRVMKSVLIRNVKRADSGMYVCSAANVAGERTETTYVTVYDNRNQTERNVTAFGISSGKAFIAWTLAVLPDVVYKIQIHQQLDGFGSENVFEFNVPNGEESGNFFVSNLKAASTHEVTVMSVDGTGVSQPVIIGDVSFTTLPILSPEIMRANRINEDASNVILECVVRGDPIPTLTWKRDDLPHSFFQGFDFDVKGIVDIKVTVNMSELTTRSILHLPYSSDDNNYTCEANNKHGEDRTIITLHREDWEDVTNSELLLTTNTVSPQVQSQINESEQNLTVTVLSVSVNKARLQWEFSTSPVLNYIISVHSLAPHSDMRSVHKFYVLPGQTEGHFVVPFLESDTTYLISVISVDINREIRQVPVRNIVFTTSSPSPPTILDAGIITGSKKFFKMECLAQGDPIPDIFWIRDDSKSHLLSGFNFDVRGVVKVKVDVDTLLHTVHSILRLPDFDYVHNFTCTAKNKFGFDTATISARPVTRQYLPEIVNISVIDKNDENTTIQCMVQGDPPPRISWRRNDLQFPFRPGFNDNIHGLVNISETVNMSLHTTVSVLHIPFIKDVYNFTCTARNVYGSDTATIDLASSENPHTKLEPVQSVAVLALSLSKVRVEWRPPKNVDINTTTYNITCSKRGNTTDMFYEMEVNTTSCVISDLRPSTEYRISIQSMDIDGQIGPSTSVFFVTNTAPLLPPLNVTVTKVDSSRVLVKWSDVNDTANSVLKVQWKRGQNGEMFVTRVPDGNTSYLLTGLDPETTYLVRVVDKSESEELYSEWVEITTQSDLSVNESRPPPPPDDVFLVIANSTILAQWLPPTKESGAVILQYHVRVSKETTETNSFFLPQDKTSVIVSGIEPGLRYTVGVRSVNNAGESDAIIKTIILPEQGPVRDWNVVAMSPRSVFISWEPPSEGTVTAYRLNYSPVPGALNETETLTLAPQERNHTIRYLQTFTEYTVGVQAISGPHGSKLSWKKVRTLSTVPSSPPQEVAIAGINSTAVRLTWLPPPVWAQNGELTGYKLMHKAENSQRIQSTFLLPNNTDYTLTDLAPDTTYMFRVAAQTVNGTGPMTQWYIATTEQDLKTVPDIPDGLNITSLPRALLVQWSAPINDRVPIQGFIVGYGRYIPEVHRFVVTPSSSQFTIQKLKSTTKYIVSVRAFNMYGESHPVFATGWTGSGAEKTESQIFSTRAPRTSTYQYTNTPGSIKGTSNIEVTNLYARPQLVDVSSGRNRISLVLTPPISSRKTRYKVQYKQKNSEGPWQILMANSNYITLRKLESSMAYFMSIQAVSGSSISQVLELTASTSKF